MTIPIRGPSSPQLAPVLYPLEEHTVVFTSRLVLRAHVAVGIHRKLTPVATCVQSCTYIHPYIHTYELSAHVNCQLVLQVSLFLIAIPHQRALLLTWMKVYKVSNPSLSIGFVSLFVATVPPAM